MENKFEELNIEKNILDALDDLSITVPSEIQAASIPLMLEGIDIIGQAQTGTGKTFSYGIPTISKIDTKNRFVQALILCPTRELSIQVSNELTKLIKYKEEIKIATVYGGESYEKQIRVLKQKPQIVVGTPGRIIDHLNKGFLSFANITTLVLDEADEMLKMGFQEDLETILKETPKERQTALFSATMPDFIKKIALKYQNDPKHIIIKKKTLTVDRIEQELYYCKRESKNDLLIRLLDYYNFNSCIIFANTKSKVDELILFLQKNNYNVDGIHGDLKQLVRDRVMNSFRTGAINILVATDVAARGIDISGLSAIINFDLPQEDELYVHRIGRTGRAGEKGLSISIATPSEKRKVSIIEQFTKSKMILKEIPSVEAIEEKISLRLLDIINENLDSSMDKNYIILNKLAKREQDPAKIINSLINIILSNKRRSYNKISNVNNDIKKNNTFKGFNDNKNNQYVYAKLNIGKKELLRPQILLSLMEKLGGVRKSNIGDIVIRKSGSTIEITKGAFAYLKKIEGKKYQGTVIKVSKVKGMEE